MVLKVISILDPPKLNKAFNNLEPLAEGGYFSYSCAAISGSQPIIFYWFKDGQTITSQSKNIQIIEFGKMQSNLIIENVKAIDSANYTCNAKNDFGEDNHSVRLIVRGKINDLITNY